MEKLFINLFGIVFGAIVGSAGGIISGIANTKKSPWAMKIVDRFPFFLLPMGVLFSTIGLVIASGKHSESAWFILVVAGAAYTSVAGFLFWMRLRNPASIEQTQGEQQ